MTDNDIRYSYENAPTIRAFATSNAFIRGLMGPFGSGKSSGCVMQIIYHAMRQEPSKDGIRYTRWAVVRNTYPQLEDTSIKTFQDWLPPIHFGKYNKSKHIYTITGIKGLHIEVLFRALDLPKHVQNLLSLELTGAWINEAREIPWAILEALIGRVRRYPSKRDVGPTWSGIICDTNPPDDESWWYRMFEEDDDPRVKQLANTVERLTGQPFKEVFKQPSGLSPEAENVNFLANGYYETMAMNPDEDWVKVHVHGLYGFLKDGKPVYPSYRDSLHCRPTPYIKGLTIYRGWDYGLTPACAFCQITPSGQFRIFREENAERAGIEEFGTAILKICADEYPEADFEDIGDPNGSAGVQTNAKSCFAIQKGMGIEVRPGKETIAIRVESVRYPLAHLIDGEPGLVIDRSCKRLRKGFAGKYQYRRVQTSQEKYMDKPDKNMYSHLHDALQYVASILFGDIIKNKLPNKSSGTQVTAVDMGNVFEDEVQTEAVDSTPWDDNI